jgi:hypothetical protein
VTKEEVPEPVGVLINADKKQASRDADAAALASGEKTREDLRKENSLFAPFGKIRILWKGAKPLK